MRPQPLQLSHCGHKHGDPENPLPLMEKQLTGCPNQALASPRTPSYALQRTCVQYLLGALFTSLTYGIDSLAKDYMSV